MKGFFDVPKQLCKKVDETLCLSAAMMKDKLGDENYKEMIKIFGFHSTSENIKIRLGFSMERLLLNAVPAYGMALSKLYSYMFINEHDSFLSDTINFAPSFIGYKILGSILLRAAGDDVISTKKYLGKQGSEVASLDQKEIEAKFSRGLDLIIGLGMVAKPGIEYLLYRQCENPIIDSMIGFAALNNSFSKYLKDPDDYGLKERQKVKELKEMKNAVPIGI